MALVKKIEIDVKGELWRLGFYIGLFDSNGDAYNFSEGINFPAANGELQDGIKTTTSEFTLNNDPVGSVTVAPVQKYGDMSVCMYSDILKIFNGSWWTDNMLFFSFGARTDQPAPWKIILTFSKTIDIYKVTLFQDELGGGAPIGDLEIKVIDEKQATLASAAYTAEQQSLDYPKEVLGAETPEVPFTPPFVPLNLRPTLPKSIKVMSIDGGLYIRPKQA